MLLVAELRSGGAWQIAREIPDDSPPEERASQLSAMLEELVYSVFSSFSRRAGLNWAALRHFSIGLRALRDAQSSQLLRSENFRLAEEQLLAARGLAQSFARCSYLLGVVYEGLADSVESVDRSAAANWQASARAAFIHALAEDPRNLDAAYAIAWQSYRRGADDSDQYAFTVEFADRMIAINRADKRAWNIRGEALRLLRSRDTARPEQSWKRSLDDLETAAALLWREACAHAWTGWIPRELRHDQADYLTNLGVTIWNSGLFPWGLRAHMVLRQALWRNPAARPAAEWARMLDFDNFRGMSGQFRRIRLKLLSFVQGGWTAESMYRRAIFASASLAERTRIRAWFAMSLYKARAEGSPLTRYIFKRIELLFPSEAHFTETSNLLKEAFAELIESPSLIRGNEQEALLNLLTNNRPSADKKWFPDSFYIEKIFRTEANSKGLIILWTDIYQEKLIQNLHCGNLSEFYCHSGKAKELKKAWNYTHIYREFANTRNHVMWLRGYVKILCGSTLINEADKIIDLRKRRRVLKYGIKKLKNGVEIYDQEQGFPREHLLVDAFRKLSEAENRLMQLDADPVTFATFAGNSVKDAEKGKARAPFEPGGYMALVSSYAARLDFEAAEKFATMGQSLSPTDQAFIYGLGTIYWNKGAQMLNRVERKSHFCRVVKLFDDYLVRLTNDGERGYMHFWLGRFHGDLGNYDKSRAHYQISRSLNYHSIETHMYDASNSIEQEQFDLAQYSLDEAIYQLSASRRRFMRRKRAMQTRQEWLSEVDDGAGQPDDKRLFGFLLPQVIILRALVQCERGDFSRAKRGLTMGARFAKRLPLRTKTSRNAIVERRDSRRSLEAQCRDVDGRIELGLGHTMKAKDLFEESLRIKEDEGTAYQLARLTVAEAESAKFRKADLEKATRAINHVRRIDIRNVYEARVKNLERRLERLGAAKSSAAR